MREAIDRPQTATQPVESVIESKDCTDWFEEVQNQPELLLSENAALTVEF